ncbi:hypothetical protein P43SY_000083 [Pythium insidiosum]|uniref:BCNT-C domain-containing protein n=1 Tax=Pythium insidiosum TaxID=114742 RepID=A0AAD5Q6S6_PYTIN|nr:hypothetical protein P43SY_000083 [Pythium insidiosum]
MSGYSSEEDDEDFVPTEDVEPSTTRRAAGDGEEETAMAERCSVKGDVRVSKMWDDINTSTAVSTRSAQKTAKLLEALASGKPMRRKGKRKLHEFKVPVLSVDVKKRRGDIAAADEKEDVKQVVKFAGVEYSVSKKAPVAKSGASQRLDQVLAALDAPKKVSTIEKSSIDWDKFKEQEGIEDELTQYTKDGYIEKQEFLQRLDQKRFEIEKAERERERQQRQQQQQPSS